MTTTTPWAELGRRLARHRIAQHPAMSKRAAAERAGFSEATWRQLEAGKRQLAPGVEVEMSARAETVVRAAMAVGMDPTEALDLVSLEHAVIDEPRHGGSDEMTLTQLVVELVAEMRSLREELQRLGDAYEQLASPPLAPSVPAARQPRPASPAFHGAAR